MKQLVGFHSHEPRTVAVGSAADVEVAIDFTGVDSMSCSLREVRLHAAALQSAGIDVLKTWAEALSRRITYLLENIGPLEVDPDAGHVLIRSTPPDQQADRTQFYEIVLQTRLPGQFSLRRFRSEKGKPGRTQVDMHATHEVLVKLVGDLVATIPAA